MKVICSVDAAEPFPFCETNFLLSCGPHLYAFALWAAHVIIEVCRCYIISWFIYSELVVHADRNTSTSEIKEAGSSSSWFLINWLARKACWWCLCACACNTLRQITQSYADIWIFNCTADVWLTFFTHDGVSDDLTLRQIIAERACLFSPSFQHVCNIHHRQGKKSVHRCFYLRNPGRFYVMMTDMFLTGRFCSLVAVWRTANPIIHLLKPRDSVSCHLLKNFFKGRNYGWTSFN